MENARLVKAAKTEFIQVLYRNSFTQDTKGCSIPIKIPVNGDGKALNNAEGFFDQIDKDLNVILGW